MSICSLISVTYVCSVYAYRGPEGRQQFIHVCVYLFIDNIYLNLRHMESQWCITSCMLRHIAQGPAVVAPVCFFPLKIPGRRGLQMNRYDWMEIRKLCWHNKMFQGFDAPAIFKRQTPPICHKSLRVNPRHKASIGRGVDLGNYPYQHNRSTIGCVSKCGKFSREDYD